MSIWLNYFWKQHHKNDSTPTHLTELDLNSPTQTKKNKDNPKQAFPQGLSKPF